MAATHTQEHPGDIFHPKRKDRLPTTLNVLTILAFIWSALEFGGAFFAFAIAPFGYETALRNQARWDRIPIALQSLLGTHQVESARLLLENRIPILLINFTAVLLCFFGALQMRKLRKRGYGIALIFIILYATQLKYMN